MTRALGSSSFRTGAKWARQLKHRCGLRGTDGTEVVQIDWAWPEDTYVGEYEVYDYAAHDVATEIALSRRVSDYLRAAHAGADAGAESAGGAVR